MLQAFIDESFDNSPPVYSMAGFISTAERWAAFAKEWREYLDMKPRISNFKMNDAMALKGEFRWWRPDARDQKLALLIGVINEHAIAGVSSSVRHDQYRALFPKEEGWEKHIRGPYYFLVVGLVQQLARHQHQLGLSDKIDFVFDEQVMEKAQIIEDWEAVKRITIAPKHLLGSTPIFSDDEDALPLQAADLFAGFTRMTLQHQLRGEPPMALPKLPHHKNIPAFRMLWSEKDLKEMKAHLEKKRSE